MVSVSICTLGIILGADVTKSIVLFACFLRLNKDTDLALLSIVQRMLTLFKYFNHPHFQYFKPSNIWF
jgi:hypothetical protein